jgi:large subunit ribosomal protein L1
MNRKSITDSITKALEDKGKRKFTQSVEFIVNFRNIDFTKAENRLNLDLILPKGKGKEQKVVVFADGQMAFEAKAAGASEVIDQAGIAKLAGDKNHLKTLAGDCEFVAQPNLMVHVGKSLGQVLGARGRLPRPVTGPIKDAILQAKSRVRLVSKGKYLPVAQCVIGSEAMDAADLADNFDAVYEKVKAKATEPNIKSIYVKLSMGAPVKVL